jgi:hypothetical protein
MNNNFANNTKRNATLNALRRQEADKFALSIQPFVDKLSEFDLTHHHMAEALNHMGLRTPQGCYWAYKSVRNLCARLDAIAVRKSAERLDLLTWMDLEPLPINLME